jgi:hypothetical protein
MVCKCASGQVGKWTTHVPRPKSPVFQLRRSGMLVARGMLPGIKAPEVRHSRPRPNPPPGGREFRLEADLLV